MQPGTSTTEALSELVRRYRPQLAQLVKAPPPGREFVHELKLDGYRAGAAIAGGEARIVSRNGRDFGRDFPEIVAALPAIKASEALIDGEIVIVDERGRTHFQALQNRATSREGLTFFVFDLLWLDGRDVSRLPLEERKALLARIVTDAGPRIRYLEHLDVDGEEMHRRACDLGAEGVVSKRRTAPYRHGARGDEWQKAKCELRQEFIVGGFTDPTSEARALGSMLIGTRRDGKLVWVGKVSRGVGMTETFRREMRQRLEAIEQKSSPFDPPVPGWLGQNAHWVKPEVVVEVRFSEWTDAGQVRHPTLEGVREDKAASEVVREEPTVVMQKPDTMVFPARGLRRADLARFYEEIASVALPHIVGRPLTLVRCTGPIEEQNALRSQCEFLKHTREWNRFVPDWVPRVRIPEQKKVGEYVVIDGLPALIALIDRGIVELHVWGSRAADVERPDRIVFDIDPGDGATWNQVIDTARLLRDELELLGLASWPKTTGGKGLHVVVPFVPEQSWDDVFAFSREFAEHLAREHPDLTTSFKKEDRRGKVLIDYKRNHRTAIAVAPYSIRARPHAPVAVPVGWHEVNARLRSDSFTVETLPRRLARLREDPWADLLRSTQRLP